MRTYLKTPKRSQKRSKSNETALATGIAIRKALWSLDKQVNVSKPWRSTLSPRTSLGAMYLGMHRATIQQVGGVKPEA